MKIEGNLEIVFWALVGLLVGTAFRMVWHLSELVLASTSGLSGAVIHSRAIPRFDRCTM